MASFHRWIGLHALWLCCAGCSFPAIADVSVGPFEYTVRVPDNAVPRALVAEDGTVRTVACGSDADCSPLSSEMLAVRCVESVCRPDPIAFALATEVVDIGMNATVARYGDRIQVIEIRNGAYAAVSQGLRGPVGPIEIFWSPATAATIDDPDVRLLGVIPETDLTVSERTEGAIEIEREGSAALSEYLLRTARTIRLFARPRIAIVPGTAAPQGGVTLQVELGVHVEGQLVR